MQVGVKGGYDCVQAFYDTDFIDNSTSFDIPTLIVHGGLHRLGPGGRCASCRHQVGRMVLAVAQVPGHKVGTDTVGDLLSVEALSS